MKGMFGITLHNLMSGSKTSKREQPVFFHDFGKRPGQNIDFAVNVDYKRVDFVTRHTWNVVSLAKEDKIGFRTITDLELTLINLEVTPLLLLLPSAFTVPAATLKTFTA